MRSFPTWVFCLLLSALAVPATAASITPSQIGVVTTDLPANAASTLSALGGLAGVSWTPGGVGDPGGPHNTNTYAQFNLSGYSGSVSNVQLTLAAEPSLFGSSPTPTSPVEIDLYAVTQPFSVGTVGGSDGIFWGSQPTNGGTILASASEAGSSGSLTFSSPLLTALVQSWIDTPGSNNGLVLEAAPVGVQDGSGGYIGAWFGGATLAPANYPSPTLSFSTAAATVPEPSSLAMALGLATTLTGVVWRRRRR